MNALLHVQRAAFLREGPPSLEVRRNRLDRLTRAILDHADEIASALSADFGDRPEPASLMADVVGILPGIAHGSVAEPVSTRAGISSGSPGRASARPTHPLAARRIR